MHYVLLVEDDTEIRELLAEMFESAGIAVEAAENGEEALVCMRRAKPCVIVLDLMMPVMNGWQLRAQMLDDAALADIPVIVVSGAGDLLESSPSLKANEVFAKPVPWTTLLAAVKRHCGS